MGNRKTQNPCQRLEILADAYSAVIMAVYDGERVEEAEPRIMREANRKLDALASHQEMNSRRYIGLKNRTGKKIYEGDIIKTKDIIWLVEPIGSLERDGSYYGLCASMNGDGNNYFIDESILAGEIIGNIYEHPKLLEG